MNQRKYLAVLRIFVAAGLSASFAWLYLLVKANPVWSFDRAITLWLQEYRTTSLDVVMFFIRDYGRPEHLLLLAIFLMPVLLLVKERKTALFLAVVAVVFPVLAAGLKYLHFRTRPDPLLVMVMEQNTSSSFPSGTALSYVLLFGFLIFITVRTNRVHRAMKTICALIGAALITMACLSRIYLGAHWFTDVAAGVIAGLIFLWLICSAYCQYKKAPEFG